MCSKSLSWSFQDACSKYGECDEPQKQLSQNPCNSTSAVLLTLGATGKLQIMSETCKITKFEPKLDLRFAVWFPNQCLHCGGSDGVFYEWEG